jgi:hypothetical protein
MILIATIERAVPFDIFAFYRGRHTYFGIDTLALSTVETCDRLDAMRDGFESGALKPYDIAPRDPWRMLKGPMRPYSARRATARLRAKRGAQ